MNDIVFDKNDLIEIEKIKAKYPDSKSAVMPVLWYAQDKFGDTNTDIQKLVAATLDLPPSHVYGVVTFYTQYYDEPKGKFVLDVCTCLSCHLCGGYDMLHYAEEKLGIKAGETTDDGLFSLQSVECLGACGYAPMMQVTNDKFVNHLTKEKLDKVIQSLKNGKGIEFEPIVIQQHQNAPK
ncbi:MAG: NAD(P)H-dependent oxidoreductase subunit E [Balneolales bacterium]